jgi:hypothetical protein
MGNFLFARELIFEIGKNGMRAIPQLWLLRQNPESGVDQIFICRAAGIGHPASASSSCAV